MHVKERKGRRRRGTSRRPPPAGSWSRFPQSAVILQGEGKAGIERRRGREKRGCHLPKVKIGEKSLSAYSAEGKGREGEGEAITGTLYLLWFLPSGAEQHLHKHVLLTFL